MNLKKWYLVIATISIFAFGMYFSSLKKDSSNLKELKKLSSDSKKNQLSIKDKSAELEIKLQKVRAYERQNFKQAQTTRNTDNRGCVDANFVELYNKQTEEYERIFSGKYTD